MRFLSVKGISLTQPSKLFKGFLSGKNDIHSLGLKNTLFHDNQYWYSLMQDNEPIVLPKFIHPIKFVN